MAMTVCDECGKDVSSKARECPHCGNPLTSGKQATGAAADAAGWFVKWVARGTVIGMIAVAGLILYLW